MRTLVLSLAVALLVAGVGLGVLENVNRRWDGQDQVFWDVTRLRGPMSFSMHLDRTDVAAHAPALLEAVDRLDDGGLHTASIDAQEMPAIEAYLRGRTTPESPEWRFFVLDGRSYAINDHIV